MASAKRKSSLTKRFPRKRSVVKGTSAKWRTVLAVLLVLALSPFYYKSLTPAWRWLTNTVYNPNYPVYKNFNIRIPNKYAIHGIDVSAYQGTINWQKVKNMREDSIHISFAYIRATQGILQVDPYFDRNWRECQKAGIPCGAYHYFKPKFAGKWQAIFFLQNVTLNKGSLPLAVDVEELGDVTPEKMRQELNDFLKEITLKTRTKPIIYSGLKFYRDNLEGYFDNYSLWLSNFDNPELTVSPNTPWKFWQHSDRATIDGIRHDVDFDVFRGDSAAFKKMAVK